MLWLAIQTPEKVVDSGSGQRVYSSNQPDVCSLLEVGTVQAGFSSNWNRNWYYLPGLIRSIFNKKKKIIKLFSSS